MPNYAYFSLNAVLSLFVLLWSTIVLSAPSGSVSFQGDTPVQDVTVTITGDGFGEKNKVGPVIYDLSDMAYLNGSIDTSQGGLGEGDPLLRDDPDVYWAKPSIPPGGSNVLVTYEKEHRHNSITAHYMFDGFNGFLGWPKAYGGEMTPGNNNKLYVSWWYKPYRDPRFYWRWELSNVVGKFRTGSDPYKSGEKLSINSPLLGVISGEVIALENNELHFMAFGATASVHLRGATIKGLESGATAFFPDDDNAFLSPGSNKFIRIWEESTGKDGFFHAWTQMNTTIRKNDGVTNIVSSVKTGVQVNRWNHMEVELDLTNNRYREWVNSKLHREIDTSQALRNGSSFSPTIALLGFNGNVPQYQRTEFGEIYMDNTLQRVVVANAADLNDITHAEIQRPEAWSNDSISFKLNLGAFKTVNDYSLYVYVFDQDGVVNTTGMKLCSACLAPPNPVKDLQ